MREGRRSATQNDGLPVLKLAHKVWQRALSLLPAEGFYFDRPIVVFQSDDWGRVGLRDRAGFEELQAAGLFLGERPYDLYTLETADDVAALMTLLKRHRDSGGAHPSLGLNFILSNLDFAKMAAEGFRQIHLLSLADGLPSRWVRPGLADAYREGIAEGVFHPALHGSTHFCRAAVERSLLHEHDSERAALLRKLWKAGTPYIHWRMPWIGYEYWDPEQLEEERMLPVEAQQKIIGEAVGGFAKMFSALPRSACAPGYRANDDTHRAWAQHGIRVAQNGPGDGAPPYFDPFGILQLSRNIEFEPATDAAFSVEECLREAEACFERGVPAIVSVHSINFHSTVKDFRSRTLPALDQFLCCLESKYPRLLYLHDDALCELTQTGVCKTQDAVVDIVVTRKKFTRAG